MSGKSDTTATTFTTLGVRPSAEISFGRLNATLHGMLGWRHAFGGITPQSTVAFAGGNPFTVNGAPIAKDAGVLEVGTDLHLTRNANLSFTYGGQFSGAAIDQSVRGTLTVLF